MSSPLLATNREATPAAGQLPLVRLSDSIREAMAVIDASSQGIALVVDDCRRLKGVVTDGDIRRAILSGTNLDVDLARLLARKLGSAPITAPVGTSKEELRTLMHEFSVQPIPFLDDQGRFTVV